MRLSRQFYSTSGSFALSLFTLVWMPTAHAQLSGSAGLLSNYLYRGISLSQDQPAARIALNYDAAPGWYAGAQLVNGQLAGSARRDAQWTTYAGYARRWPSGLAWDAGMTSYVFSHQSGWNFREMYAGLATDNLSARLHYSPDYLGMGERTVYAEVNGGSMLAADWQAFWHGGYLCAPGHALSNRAETRLGVATEYQRWQLQFSLDSTRLRAASSAVSPYGASGPAVDSSAAVRWQHKLVLALVRSF